MNSFCCAKMIVFIIKSISCGPDRDCHLSCIDIRNVFRQTVERELVHRLHMHNYALRARRQERGGT